MNIEGIIIQKTAYKERDLICHVLLRSGKTLPVYFYGGRGGGKYSKGSIIEVGFMLKIQLATQRKKLDADIKIAKEYKLLWDGARIREDFKAFYLLSFFLEYIAKVAVQEDFSHVESEEYQGVFNVLSNSLFYLNQSIESNAVDYKKSLFMFLAKLSLQLGVNPETENCLICIKPFQSNDLSLFEHQSGGFICYDCVSRKDEFLSENKLELQELQNSNMLRIRFRNALKLEFKSMPELSEIGEGQVISLFNYINYQFGFTKDQIKTWSMVTS